MKASTLLHLFFQVVLLFDALGWEVKMLKEIHGLRGSCLVIPCTFNYTSNPPKNPRRVVWYQWAFIGYPLVYDPLHTDKVIVKFRGKTDLYGNSSRGCSLLIRNLEQSHRGEIVYAWIDPENVKKNTYSFFDVTTTILVDARPQLPIISISGGERMGDTITVTCSTSHTCPYSKPNITLNGIEGSDQIDNDCDTNGQCRITLTRKGVIKAVNTTIECSVTHHGGIQATASQVKTALCVPYNISIEPELADVTEGVAQIFTCSVYHSCQRETPNITWNYRNMQVSEGSKTLSGINHVTYSNITFLGASEDHGRKLNCTAKFSGGGITASVVLHVRCVTFKISIDPELADVTEGVTKIFTCSVYHSCQRETPTITWNYENMQVSEGNKALSGLHCVTYSNITFLGAAEDHGKELICTAKLVGENVTTSVHLNVQYLKLFGLKTISLYILTPSLVLLLAGLFCGLIIYKRQQRSGTLTGNKPRSKPSMPSPRSDPISISDYDCEAEYVNLEELYVYGNI